MPFRLSLLSLAAACALAASSLAAAPAPAPPPPANHVQRLPTARIQHTLDAYKTWLQKLEARHGAAGLATAIVVDGKVVFEGTIGSADTRSGTPVTPDTVFRLASLSKAFAATLTGLLVADGKLSWDMHVADVLPYFQLKDAAGTAQATIGDILGQRLGLPRNTYDNQLEANASYEELVRKLDEVDMTCGVGQCYGYQNVAFSMIGDVVLARTGDFFYRLVDKRIFHPLGMNSASYGRAALEASRSWARPHRAARQGWIPFEPNEVYYRVAPAAGVNASLRDMEKWLVAQMGDRPDVLAPALLATLHAPGVATPGETTATPWRRARLSSAHYALGWRVYTYGGETLVYHAGAVAGYRTMIGFFPKYDVGMVTMWNSNGSAPSGLMPMVFDGLLGLPAVDWAGLDKPPVKSAPAQRRPAARRTAAKR